MIERADRWNEAKAKGKSKKAKSETRRLVSLKDAEIDFTRFLSGSNLSNKLKNLAAENRDFGETASDYIQDVWRETSLLQSAFENLKKPPDSKCLMIFRCADVYFGKQMIPSFSETYHKIFNEELGLKAEFPENKNSSKDYFETYLMLEGVFGFDLAKAEKGNHVFVNRRGDFTPVEIDAVELNENEDFTGEIEKQIEKDFSVVRIYNERGIALDFRSGLITKENLTFRELRSFILSGLETPKEFTNSGK
jgi:hypothetical protein